MKISNQKIFVGAFILIFLFVLFFQYPEQTATEFTPEMCGKVDFEIESISCSNNIFEIKLKNAGEVSLDGSFLTLITTENMWAYVANDTDKPIRAGSQGNLIIDAENMEGVVRRIQISFQDCPEAQTEKEGLNLTCI